MNLGGNSLTPAVNQNPQFLFRAVSLSIHVVDYGSSAGKPLVINPLEKKTHFMRIAWNFIRFVRLCLSCAEILCFWKEQLEKKGKILAFEFTDVK